MKTIFKKCIFILVLITILFFDVNSVNAGQGCCSWHGGQAYCDRSTGRWVCNDGTYSPSCRCSSYELTDDYNNNYITNEEENDDIVYNANETNNSNDNLSLLEIIAGIFLFSPIIYSICVIYNIFKEEIKKQK